jgi:hypothetical protein
VAESSQIVLDQYHEIIFNLIIFRRTSAQTISILPIIRCTTQIIELVASAT